MSHKHIYLLLLNLILITAVSADDKISGNNNSDLSYNNGIIKSQEIYGVYRVPAVARGILEEMKATVRHGKMEGDFIAELTAEQVEYLEASNIHPVKLFDSIAQEDSLFRSGPEYREFHTYTQIINGMYAYAANFPNITQIADLGNSVQGRELLAIKITDNPTVEEDEPEVAFWGNIHGNEYASGEMPYMYMIYLCENYGIVPSVTEYVNSNEIWCIPMINPDGRVNGTRDNANSVDLNREFGYNWDAWGASPYPFSQVESRAVRELGIENSVCLSVSYHCFGDEFYYPWGYFPNPAPDYNVLTRVGQRYASAANYGFMSSFQSYETHGEILDWAYGCLGGLSYTAEISSSSSQIQVTFERNQAGMNIFLDLANEGLHGTVTDAQTGEPLYAAVWISGDPIPAYTDPAIGDLHRIVPPGIYDLTVWANGYLPQTINDVQVLYGTPGQFSASLEPGGGEYAFMVNSVNQHDPNNVWNNVTFPARALRAPDNLPCSLGSYGFIILDMGAGHEIVDGPGDDFTITEAIFPRDTHPERYHVYAGDPYLPNIWIGHGYGTTSFDLNGTGIDSVRYLRIISLYTASPNLPFAGFDLDAVTIINSAMTASLAISGELAMPEEIKVTAYPNPFNTKTLISFQLPTASEVSLKVYNLQGREVANLMDGRLSAGKHTAAFDGSQLASGVYFYVIKTGGFSISQKMLLIK